MKPPLILPPFLLACLGALTLHAQSPPRSPVPEAAAVSREETAVKELFKADYAKRSANDRKLLAKKLLEQGKLTKDNPAAQYVLLREAMAVAAELADTETALEATEALAAAFDLPPRTVRMELLALVQKSTGGAEALPRLLPVYFLVADEAVANDDFAGALKVLGAAHSVAGKLRDTAITAQLVSRAADIRAMQTDFAGYQAAQQTLQSNPADPAANVIAGKFLCFAKNNWDAGLPLLVRSNHPALKPLAEKELAKPALPEPRVALADEWMKLAQSTPDLRKAAQRRALKWYDEALLQADGLTRAKIEQQISAAATWAPVQWITEKSSALRPSGYVTSLDLAFLVAEKDKSMAFCTPRETPTITIDLKGQWRVTRMELKNVKGLEERNRTVTAWISESPEGPWVEIWRCKKVQASWSVDLATPAIGRFLKIGNQEVEHFQLNSLKIFGQKRLP